MHSWAGSWAGAELLVLLTEERLINRTSSKALHLFLSAVEDRQ